MLVSADGFSGSHRFLGGFQWCIIGFIVILQCFRFFLEKSGVVDFLCLFWPEGKGTLILYYG